jgi:hypothetical protein
MLAKYGVTDAAIYALLERSYDRGDTDEKLGVVRTLTTLANTDSVKLLIKFLAAMNEKRKDNTLKENELPMVQSLINALGRTKHRDARPVLITVTSLDWTEAIKRLARSALQNIPQGGGGSDS